MTVLVTGATGRIGRHLINALLKKNEKVRILIRDRMTEFENVETFYGDLNDTESLKKAADGVDTIFHLAALVKYSSPEEELFKVNVIGTKNLLEAFKGKKFIFLSTTGVLGNSLDSPIDESTPYNPKNSYAKTKMEAEKLVKAAEGIIIRAPDVMMPRFTEGYDMIFSRIMDGTMSIVGDGKNFVDFIHITDLIEALLLAYQFGRRGQTYNVSGKGIKTQKECTEIAAKALGVETPAKHVSTFTAKLYSYGSVISKNKDFPPEFVDKMVRNRTYDLTKAKTDLGYEPRVEIEAAIKEMAQNFLERLEEKQDKVPEEESEEQG
jgi:dihydroflavonol-4-reductase